MQVVMNKCFLPKSEKKLAQIHLVVLRKTQKPFTSDALQFQKK